MPELPEIRAHAARLDERYAGATLARFEPLSFTALKTFDPPPDAAVGTALARVRARGKHLLLEFPPACFVVHLMQGGRLRADPKSARKPRGGLARWSFDGLDPLLLTEAGTEHRAGVWVVRGDPLAQPPLDDLGPEADEPGSTDLGARLRAATGRLHGVLRDQQVLAGIGRRLANEICHRARLSPFASVKKLTGADVAALHRAIREAIDDSLAFEAAQEEMVGSKDRPAAVHGRAGQPCPVCGDAVRAVEYRSYTVNYCATCQTGGRVLADNTTSKFLR